MHALTANPCSESKSHEGLARKFVPVIVTVIFDWPCTPVLGLTLVIVGAGLELPVCTVKPLVNVEFWPSVLVTVTFRDPTTALEGILIFAVICTDEL